MKSSAASAFAAQIVLCALLAALSVGVHAGTLPAAHDLATDAQLADAQGRVVLVFYSRADCRYCTLVSKNYLTPLLSDPRYKDRLLIREVDLDSHRALTGFDGQMLSHARLAKREKIRFVPVVAFHGSAGRTLAEPLIGIGSVDFYGSYLEGALERALENAGHSAKQ